MHSDIPKTHEIKGQGAGAQTYPAHDFARTNEPGSQGHSAEATSQKRMQDPLAPLLSRVREHPREYTFTQGGETWNREYVQRLTSGVMDSFNHLMDRDARKTPASSLSSHEPSLAEMGLEGYARDVTVRVSMLDTVAERMQREGASAQTIYASLKPADQQKYDDEYYAYYPQEDPSPAFAPSSEPSGSALLTYSAKEQFYHSTTGNIVGGSGSSSQEAGRQPHAEYTAPPQHSTGFYQEPYGDSSIAAPHPSQLREIVYAYPEGPTSKQELPPNKRLRLRSPTRNKDMAEAGRDVVDVIYEKTVKGDNEKFAKFINKTRAREERPKNGPNEKGKLISYELKKFDVENAEAKGTSPRDFKNVSSHVKNVRESEINKRRGKGKEKEYDKKIYSDANMLREYIYFKHGLNVPTMEEGDKFQTIRKIQEKARNIANAGGYDIPELKLSIHELMPYAREYAESRANRAAQPEEALPASQGELMPEVDFQSLRHNVFDAFK